MTVSLSKRPHLREIGESDRLRGVSHQQVCNLIAAVDATVPTAERRDLMEMFGLVEPPVKRKRTGCGSAEGWRRHQRNRTVPCQPCLNAWADYHRERGTRGAE